MSTPTKGNCCVCGEETDKRCSACSFAGVDLFFCSREHQKLIWKTHGKVCGVNSNPFRPPDFSSDEIELAKRTLHTSLEVAAPRCRQLSAYPPSTLRQMTCGAVLSIALEVPQADGGQQECFSLVSKLSAIVSAGFPGVVQLVSPPGEDGQGWKVAVIDAADAPEYARKMASR
ncbi:hypothetical protein JCM10207_004842 [Rhodosporidiobolus poonsookiae]